MKRLVTLLLCILVSLSWVSHKSLAATKTSGTLVGHVKVMPLKFQKDAVVYIANPMAGPSNRTATVDQKGMKFLPRVDVFQVGTLVTFKNSDPFPHDVMSPEGHFDLGLIDGGHQKQYRFSKLGAFTLLCSIHPGMVGYVRVVPSPYFTKVDDKGNFTLANVPTGNYSLVAWVHGLKQSLRAVSVRTGKTTTMNFYVHR